MKSENPVPLFHSDTKPFVEHLDDLRSTIVKVIVTFMIGTIVCFYFAPQLLSVLKYPLFRIVHDYPNAPALDSMLRSLNPTGAFMMGMKLALICGIIITLPLNLYFIAQFLLPALTKSEKRYLIPVFMTGTFLFLIGLIFCYYAILPFSLKFLWGFARWLKVNADWTLEYYVSFVSQFLLIAGLTFELPIIVLSLVKLNVLSYQFLKTKRRYVIVIIFIVAAVITPQPDAISQLLMAIPLLILYEISVLGAYYIDKKHASSKDLAG